MHCNTLIFRAYLFIRTICWMSQCFKVPKHNRSSLAILQNTLFKNWSYWQQNFSFGEVFLYWTKALSQRFKEALQHWGGLWVATDRAAHHATDFVVLKGKSERVGGSSSVCSNTRRQYFTVTRSGSLSLTRGVESVLAVWDSRLICFRADPRKPPRGNCWDWQTRAQNCHLFFPTLKENEKRGTFSTSVRFMGVENALKSPIPSRKARWRWLHLWKSRDTALAGERECARWIRCILQNLNVKTDSHNVTPDIHRLVLLIKLDSLKWLIEGTTNERWLNQQVGFVRG